MIQRSLCTILRRFDTSQISKAWQNGGCFSLEHLTQAQAFLRQYGFVVIQNIMTFEENETAIKSLVADIHEVNPNTRHINDPSKFNEKELPTSPNHTFRTTCNMAFGRFASYVRNHDRIRLAFAHMHDTKPEALACSWDNPFYTPQQSLLKDDQATQLHWDHNWWYAGEKAPLADELCVQGVYYASETNFTTPTFVCSPGSHQQWKIFCDSDENPSKNGARVLNYLPLDKFSSKFISQIDLPEPFRIHVPTRSLLLWDSRTIHGNAPPSEKSKCGEDLGRIAFAICYGPVAQRTENVQKMALLKGFAGIRTTHNPGTMLAHDKHGYPEGFVSNGETNSELSNIQLLMNPEMSEEEFRSLTQKAGVKDDSISLGNVQQGLFQSYWKENGRSEEDLFSPMLSLPTEDLRKLLHHSISRVQGTHSSEIKRNHFY